MALCSLHHLNCHCARSLTGRPCAAVWATGTEGPLQKGSSDHVAPLLNASQQLPCSHGLRPISSLWPLGPSRRPLRPPQPWLPPRHFSATGCGHTGLSAVLSVSHSHPGQSVLMPSAAWMRSSLHIGQPDSSFFCSQLRAAFLDMIMRH